MSRLFEPAELGPLRLKNRIVRAAAFEGMCPAGRPSPELAEHHAAVAEGGAGMTTVAYAAVSPDGRTFAHQMWIHPGIRRELVRVSDAVHRAGAAASLQIGHAGTMADRAVIGERPMAPSAVFNLFGLTRPRAMGREDIVRVVDDFARATRLAADAGFDAVEVQAGHGYLISQFLSPATNRRRDRWGGALQGRARLLVDVLRAVREAAADRIAVVVKMNLRDGFEGGLELDEAVEVARLAEREGADALVLSGGFSSKTPWYILRGEVPLRDMIDKERRPLHKLGMIAFGKAVVEPFPFEEAYFLDMARSVRTAVRLPLMLVGGLRRRATMERVLAEEGMDFVAMARPFIREPDFASRLREDEGAVSRCEPCNRCVAAMYYGEQRCPLRYDGR